MSKLQLDSNGRQNGKFLPGHSGNPSGRPRSDQTIKELARQHTAVAMNTLVKIAENPKVSANARVAASSVILAYGWGKPPANVSVENKQTTYVDFLLKIGEEQRQLPEHKRLTTLAAIDRTEQLIEEVMQHAEWESGGSAATLALADDAC